MNYFREFRDSLALKKEVEDLLNKSDLSLTEIKEEFDNETKKNIDTLIDDIYELLSQKDNSKFLKNKEHMTLCGVNIFKNFIDEQLFRKEDQDKLGKIRPSKIGVPLRKLIFSLNQERLKLDQLNNETFKNDLSNDLKNDPIGLKFLYGHLLESLIVMLCIGTGHNIHSIQRKVSLKYPPSKREIPKRDLSKENKEDKPDDGVIEGSIDFICDGWLIDVKTCSSFGFKKFQQRTLLQGDDPFGYIGQISTYYTALKNEIKDKDELKGAAFLAINKESGELCLLKVSEVDMIDPYTKLSQIREYLEKKEIPFEKCYEPVPQSKTSNNLVLDSNCTYCPFKFECWGDALRVFRYANGLKYFTYIEKEPNVEEVFFTNECE